LNLHLPVGKMGSSKGGWDELDIASALLEMGGRGAVVAGCFGASSSPRPMRKKMPAAIQKEEANETTEVEERLKAEIAEQEKSDKEEKQRERVEMKKADTERLQKGKKAAKDNTARHAMWRHKNQLAKDLGQETAETEEPAPTSSEADKLASPHVEGKRHDNRSDAAVSSGVGDKRAKPDESVHGSGHAHTSRGPKRKAAAKRQNTISKSSENQGLIDFEIRNMCPPFHPEREQEVEHASTSAEESAGNKREVSNLAALGGAVGADKCQRTALPSSTIPCASIIQHAAQSGLATPSDSIHHQQHVPPEDASSVVCNSPRAVRLCPHSCQKSKCAECAEDNLCEHKRKRTQCKDFGFPRAKPLKCPHGRQKYSCKECSGCPHKRIKSICVECNPEKACSHSKIKTLCTTCNPARLCEHKRLRTQCKECGFSRPQNPKCEHNRQKYNCRECRGPGICEHNRQRSRCKQCQGSGICQHYRERSLCKVRVPNTLPLRTLALLGPLRQVRARGGKASQKTAASKIEADRHYAFSLFNFFEL